MKTLSSLFIRMVVGAGMRSQSAAGRDFEANARELIAKVKQAPSRDHPFPQEDRSAVEDDDIDATRA